MFNIALLIDAIVARNFPEMHRGDELDNYLRERRSRGTLDNG